MGFVVKIPSEVMAWRGTVDNRRYDRWVGEQRRRLAKNPRPAERHFRKVADGLAERMLKRWRERLAYTPKKCYPTADSSALFFGDFAFQNAALLVEVDTDRGGEGFRDDMRRRLARERGIRVEVIEPNACFGDWRDVEAWLVDAVANAVPRTVGRDLRQDYYRMRTKHADAYAGAAEPVERQGPDVETAPPPPLATAARPADPRGDDRRQAIHDDAALLGLRVNLTSDRNGLLGEVFEAGGGEPVARFQPTRGMLWFGHWNQKVTGGWAAALRIVAHVLEKKRKTRGGLVWEAE